MTFYYILTNKICSLDIWLTIIGYIFSIAILSVSDKTGLIEFSRGIGSKGFLLVASGGTASTLKQAGLQVKCEK